jgi:F-type H+-transporting ATPase subunit alpha
MAEVRPDEISAILRKQLSGFESEVDIYDVGTSDRRWYCPGLWIE